MNKSSKIEYRNTHNRIKIEMIRIKSMYKRGFITRPQAIRMFKDALEQDFGRIVRR